MAATTIDNLSIWAVLMSGVGDAGPWPREETGRPACTQDQTEKERRQCEAGERWLHVRSLESMQQRLRLVLQMQFEFLV